MQSLFKKLYKDQKRIIGNLYSKRHIQRECLRASRESWGILKITVNSCFSIVFQTSSPCSYIYIPCAGSQGGLWMKLWGSFVCFSFVCIWHGASSSVIIWCISNYIGICLETTATCLSKQNSLIRWKVIWFSSCSEIQNDICSKFSSIFSQ